MKPRRFRIVVALDASEYAEIVLEHALDQAARHDAVDLHFITVVEPGDDVDAAKARLAALVLGGLENESKLDWHARLHVRVGPRAEEIASVAGDIDADLLVVGYFGVHGRRGRQFTADRVLELVACPTLVVALGAHVLDAHTPCDKCAAIREESEGERWFCEDHATDGRLDLTTRLPSSSTASHGGPLW